MITQNKIWASLSALVALIYYAFFGLHTVDFPFYDDFQALLQSTMLLEAEKSWIERFKFLTAFHNEHRIATVKAVGWLNFLITGKMNFSVIQLIGNLAFVGIFVYFAKTTKHAVLWLAAALMIFQLQSWDNAFWAMAAIANFWIYVWVFGCLYWLCASKPNLWLAVPFAILAVFTLGSGLFVMVVGTAVLVWRKQYKQLIIWLFFALIIGGFYLNGIEAAHPIQPNENAPRTFGRLMSFFFAFLGSNFWVPVSKYFSVSIGVFFLASYLFFVFKKLQDKHLFLMSILSFLMLTAAVVAWNRYLIGIEIPLSSRYRIAGTLVAVGVMIGWFEILAPRWQKPLSWLVLVGALGFNCISNYMYLDRVRELVFNRKMEAWLSVNQHKITGHYKPEDAIKILDDAQQKGIFKTIVSNENELIREEVKAVNLIEENIDYQIDSISQKGSKYFIEGWAMRAAQKNNLSKILLVLRAKNQQPIVLKTIAIKRYDLVRFGGKPLNYIESGFMVFVDKNKQLLASESYQIGIAIKPKIGPAAVVWTEKWLKIG